MDLFDEIKCKMHEFYQILTKIFYYIFVEGIWRKHVVRKRKIYENVLDVFKSSSSNH